MGCLGLKERPSRTHRLGSNWGWALCWLPSGGRSGGSPRSGPKSGARVFGNLAPRWGGAGRGFGQDLVPPAPTFARRPITKVPGLPVAPMSSQLRSRSRHCGAKFQTTRRLSGRTPGRPPKETCRSSKGRAVALVCATRRRPSHPPPAARPTCLLLTPLPRGARLRCAEPSSAGRELCGVVQCRRARRKPNRGLRATLWSFASRRREAPYRCSLHLARRPRPAPPPR